MKPYLMNSSRNDTCYLVCTDNTVFKVFSSQSTFDKGIGGFTLTWWNMEGDYPISPAKAERIYNRPLPTWVWDMLGLQWTRKQITVGVP